MDAHFTIPAFSSKSVLFYVGVGVTSAFGFLYGLEFGLQKMTRIIEKSQKRDDKKSREKWTKLGKDKIVLHHCRRSIVAPRPSPSPLDLKLETYFRMAKIPYETDFDENYYDEARKRSPWITVNGRHVFGSQYCVEYLAEKFQKDFSSHLSPMEKATARAFQSVCEDHLNWVLVLWRFVYSEESTEPLLSRGRRLSLFTYLVNWFWKEAATAQGMGRHSKEEVTEMAKKDLRSLSLYLGSKPYFTGEKPTEVDCAMFGTLAEIVWTTPNSFMEKLVNDELVNLKQFCERMKEEFWPDWSQCLFTSHFL